MRLAPKNGAAYAFLGLCEFGLKDYDRSLQHLLQSRELGVGDVPDLAGIARYHAAILMTRIEQYEQALRTLGEFANEGNDNPRVIEAMGIATLRMPLLPTEAAGRPARDGADGRARQLHDGDPQHRGRGRGLRGARHAISGNAERPLRLRRLPAAGAGRTRRSTEFKRELELQPAHPWSLMQIAYEYLKRGDAATALPWAKQAVSMAPNAFPARKALGQALLETGDVEGAIRELQAGLKLAPDSPGLHFTIARAYQRAGRLDDADDGARNEFTRLDRLARTQRSGAQSVGGHIDR